MRRILAGCTVMIVAGALLLGAGCGASAPEKKAGPEKYLEVKVGMTLDQAEKLLGQGQVLAERTSEDMEGKPQTLQFIAWGTEDFIAAAKEHKVKGEGVLVTVENKVKIIHTNAQVGGQFYADGVKDKVIE